MLEIVIIVLPFVLLFVLLYSAITTGKKRRKNELTGVLEPLGFELFSNIDAESLAHFNQHRSLLGFWNVQAVCIADSVSTKIVVIEYHHGKQSFVQYFLGICPKMSAPRMIIKKRTASTKSILTACWEDVLFQLRFEEDPEFEEKFIVRGEPHEVRAFLNPVRRRALCESPHVPIQFSVSNQSIFIEFPKQIDIDTFESNLSRCLAMIKIMSADNDVALVDDPLQDS